MVKIINEAIDTSVDKSNALDIGIVFTFDQSFEEIVRTVEIQMDNEGFHYNRYSIDPPDSCASYYIDITPEQLPILENMFGVSYLIYDERCNYGKDN